MLNRQRSVRKFHNFLMTRDHAAHRISGIEEPEPEPRNERTIADRSRIPDSS